MFLQVTDLLSKLELLKERKSGRCTDKCNGGCNDCIGKKLRDDLEAEFDVVERLYLQKVLSDKEFQDLSDKYLQWDCQFCKYFGCGCDLRSCDEDDYCGAEGNGYTNCNLVV